MQTKTHQGKRPRKPGKARESAEKIVPRERNPPGDSSVDRASLAIVVVLRVRVLGVVSIVSLGSLCFGLLLGFEVRDFRLCG